MVTETLGASGPELPMQVVQPADDVEAELVERPLKVGFP